MMIRPVPVLLLALVGALSACARYTAAPLDPVALGDEFGARRLDAPDLRRFLAAHGSRMADSGWRSADLALAALYYQPALDRARAAWHSARAAEITAGARPQPELQQGELGYATSADVFESRWVAALAAIFTVELGGKRGARIAAARARTAVAELELEETAWRTAQDVRQAALELASAEGRVADEARRAERIRGFAERLRRRYAEGALSRSELAAVETEEADAGAGLERERATVAAARVTLARAVGVPPAALDQQPIGLEAPPVCAPAESAESLTTVALHRRPEVGRALADYAVAEGDLATAVAGSYPDLALGPGYTWDQGIGRWSLFFAVPRLPLNANRGPIAQATARRAEAAARFAERQQAVVAEVSAALAACRLAAVEVAGADSVGQATARRAALARAAYQRGELATTDLEPLELAETRAARDLNAARRRLAAAGLALEFAIGSWPPGRVSWPDPREPVRAAETRS